MASPRRPWLAGTALAACGSPLASGQYQLKEAYVDENFFSKFAFWTDIDPTRGDVRYVGESEARAAGLARSSSDGRVYVGVDSSSSSSSEFGGRRASVRIQSRNAYNSGLFVAKINHVPAGCGIWPAFWMYGEDKEHAWPRWGEFDIYETVHDYTHVRTSLHTNANCGQDSLQPGQDFLGRWEEGKQVGEYKSFATNCDVKTTSQYENQGCSQRGPHGTAGAPFNRQGGGTIAAEWDPERGHIRTWSFLAGSEPLDLFSGRPDPDRWGAPYSHFKLSLATCPMQHFANMRMVFNVDLCGDMGESTWQWTTCPRDAYVMDGVNMTCNEFVARHPELLAEAYWSIERLDVYQRDGPLPEGLGDRIMVDFGKDISIPSADVGITVTRTAMLIGTAVAALVSAAAILYYTAASHKYRQLGMEVSPHSPQAAAWHHGQHTLHASRPRGTHVNMNTRSTTSDSRR